MRVRPAPSFPVGCVGGHNRLCVRPWRTDRGFHALCVRKTDGQNEAILAYDHFGIHSRCAGRLGAGAGERIRLDFGLCRSLFNAWERSSRSPQKTRLASQEGVGKSSGIQELLDQIGAFLGPVLFIFYIAGISLLYSFKLFRRIGR